MNSRFFIRRLESGNLLLVRHNPPDRKTRSHLTAYLSEDDGKSWIGGMMLMNVSGYRIRTEFRTTAALYASSMTLNAPGRDKFLWPYSRKMTCVQASLRQKRGFAYR